MEILGEFKFFDQSPLTRLGNYLIIPLYCPIFSATLIEIHARFQLENETSFTTKKGRSVDNSIMRAYTEAIRRAKRFIYIENQYFMGSAYGWLDDQDVHCYNVIPMEITQQICEAIAESRR